MSSLLPICEQCGGGLTLDRLEFLHETRRPQLCCTCSREPLDHSVGTFDEEEKEEAAAVLKEISQQYLSLHRMACLVAGLVISFSLGGCQLPGPAFATIQIEHKVQHPFTRPDGELIARAQFEARLR